VKNFVSRKKKTVTNAIAVKQHNSAADMSMPNEIALRQTLSCCADMDICSIGQMMCFDRGRV
jgi:hypothetical protein